MFTGLIETVGTIRVTSTRGNYQVLTIDARFDGDSLTVGESISCDGVCLTVVSFDAGGFTADASQETARRSIARSYRSGAKINLERALRVGDRLGGHFVSGHVDDVGRVDYLRPIGESLELGVIFDKRYDNLVVEKGSLAVNGVSLTVNAVRPGWCALNVIPHTASMTTLGRLTAGDPLNLEFDIIGKYVLKAHGGGGKLTKEKLIESGW